MSLSKGFTQGGSNADVVMADAYAKLNSTNIDWQKAYEAVVRDAEEEPYGESPSGIGARNIVLIICRLVLSRTWWPRQLESASLHSSGRLRLQRIRYSHPLDITYSGIQLQRLLHLDDGGRPWCPG